MNQSKTTIDVSKEIENSGIKIKELDEKILDLITEKQKIQSYVNGLKYALSLDADRIQEESSGG